MELHVGALTVTRRIAKGKGVARKLRRRGMVPAVVYGGKGESDLLALDPKELHAALDPQKRENTLIHLTIQDEDGSSAAQDSVLLKAHQIDPLRQSLLHVDFIRVALDQTVRVPVPLELTGRPEGVQLGGQLNQAFRTLDVECIPEKIPATFEVDVTWMKLGDTLRVKDLPLPEGVVICLPGEQTLGAVLVPKRGAEAAEDEAEEAGEGEGEGEEKPAGDDKAAAAPAS